MSRATFGVEGNANKFRVKPAMVALCAVLALAGCAKDNKNNLPGSGMAGGAGSSSGIASPGSVQDFDLNVGDTVYFETDSASITPIAAQTLDKQAQWLQRYQNYAIRIEGHADERGTREYNLALGARRATATKNYLVSRGIPANRLSTISYGKERPVAVCDNISCWSQNRRTVTVLTGAGS
ncbi:peptidoglycan-associated lipoprotein Pal [Martelella mediterranea]|uniref:Peptidoglycan-associated lipoprotein n=1 Tax=Martelella mediterranea DSM 17316 TaxID=1122214 RepID=A0A1U9Z225_9HYPH|nr:peptidoglycan-associated lipoprotein Pal [Martelella mediterranea]AQZ51753.1 Minor outer membrane protein Omp16 [Martelella mediterranea DSM 17316]